MSDIGDRLDALDGPTSEQLGRLWDAVREQARIDALWSATIWRYRDPEAGVFAHVHDARDLDDCPSPETPWLLTCASRDDWAQHLKGTWWATAGEARTALAAEVLDRRLAVTE